MRQKLFITAVLIFAVTVIGRVPQAYADCKSCAQAHVSKDYGFHQGERHQKKSIKEKLFHKAYCILKNQERLGLSEEQIDKIKTIKTAAKKDLIMKEAEIDVIAIDIKSQLRQDVIDVKAVNKLIDKKYDIKKAKTKSLVQALADLKSILADEQKECLKDLWKESQEAKESMKQWK